MDFSLTEEQKALVKMLEKFSKNELLPDYTKWDREEKFPYEQWKKMVDLGLVGFYMPSEYGGQEADAVTTGLVIEEICKGDYNCGLSLILQYLNSDIIMNNASDKVKAEWLPSVINGEKLFALAITEPNCGTDARALKTKAERKNDKYILNGEKSGISFCSIADAFIVFAKTDPKSISAFLVRSDLPGVTLQTYKDLGSKSLVRGSVFMENVEVPDDYLIGAEGEGFKECMKGFDLSRTLLALASTSAAQVTLEETVQYVKDRSAFGKPLARFEGVCFPIVEYLTKLEAIRSLCYKALWLRDQGLPHTKEAAMCKMLGPQYSVEAIHDCLLFHGHYGYTNEFPVEQRLRDVIGIELGDGTAQASKLVICRDVFGKEFLPY